MEVEGNFLVRQRSSERVDVGMGDISNASEYETNALFV